jgi:hypothetical protein
MSTFNESLLVRAGSDRTRGEPPVPPIVAASIFASAGEPDRARGYGRNGNPTWEAPEVALGAIEDAEALIFSSGQAASMVLMLSLTEGRERLVIAADGYHSTRRLASRLRPQRRPARPRRPTGRPRCGARACSAGRPLGRDADQPAASGGQPRPSRRGGGRRRRPDGGQQHAGDGALQQPLAWGAAGLLYPRSPGACG